MENSGVSVGREGCASSEDSVLARLCTHALRHTDHVPSARSSELDQIGLLFAWFLLVIVVGGRPTLGGAAGQGV